MAVEKTQYRSDFEPTLGEDGSDGRRDGQDASSNPDEAEPPSLNASAAVTSNRQMN
jgi:hypothetical protein